MIDAVRTRLPVKNASLSDIANACAAESDLGCGHVVSRQTDRWSADRPNDSRIRVVPGG